jgi:hypothetical protein
MSFIKGDRRFLDDTSTLCTNFLSEKIRIELNEKLGFIPKNAYIGNAAGDYMFISVVDMNGDVYTYTDSYNLNAELQDKGIDY